MSFSHVMILSRRSSDYITVDKMLTLMFICIIVIYFLNIFLMYAYISCRIPNFRIDNLGKLRHVRIWIDIQQIITVSSHFSFQNFLLKIRSVIWSPLFLACQMCHHLTCVLQLGRAMGTMPSVLNAVIWFHPLSS